MVDLFNYFRRETTEVNIGAVPLGGPNSIRVQSMTNTSTQDTQACVEQAKRIVDSTKDSETMAVFMSAQQIAFYPCR